MSKEAWAVFRSDACVLVTDSVLTSGNLIRQGWSDGKRHFETKGYPGALNYFSVKEVTPDDPYQEWCGNLKLSESR